ncbi:unnamed protein product [Urochloa humidicola]
MEGADALAVVSSNPWSLVRGYLSPATLFLLLNMVIGTIALTSSSRRHHLGEDGDQHYYQQHQSYAPPPPLARTSSVMERLRSLGLYRFRSGDFPPEYNHHLSAGRTDDDITSGGAREAAQAQYARSRSEPAVRPPPARKATNKKDEEEAVVVRAAKTKPSAEVRKLERAPAQAQTQLRRAPRAPAQRAQLVARAEEEEEDAAAVSVDARADDFINRFRQQLQLQRLNSLLNYKEMLSRGV